MGMQKRGTPNPARKALKAKLTSFHFILKAIPRFYIEICVSEHVHILF